jgi:hypothetical protein
MKLCKKCNVKQSLDSFWKKKGTKDGLGLYCISCVKSENKKHYEHNKEQYFDKRKWFFELKQGLKCEKCGFSHPAALDFHHKDPAKKNFGVSSNRNNKEQVLKEIKNCEVLCSNCHRIEHATQYNLHIYM